MQLLHIYDTLLLILPILLYFSIFTMTETFWRYNDSIEQIDVKWDKVPDWFNENQIKEKAKNYVEKRLQEWFSKEDYDKLLKNIKELLERQDIERKDLIQELR